jgi:hypothetical protein
MANEEILEQILNKLKIISDSQENIVRYLEKIDSERKIMEDIREGQVALREVLINHRDHVDNGINDVKTDIKIEGLKTADKLEETQEKIEKTTDKVNEIKQAIIK